jgi:hypothetical protein
MNKNTRRMLGAGVALAGVGVIAATSPWNLALSTSEPAPTEVVETTLALSEFQTLRFHATWHEPRAPISGSADNHLITVDDQERFVVDYVGGLHRRYLYDGDTLVRYNGIPGQDAKRYALLDQISALWADLWPEIRAGMPNTQWTRVDMAEEGYPGQRADRTWYRVDLPFQWADEATVYAAFYNGGTPTEYTARTLQEVRIRTAEDDTWIGVFKIEWNPTLEAQAFGTTIPETVFADTTPPVYPTQ